MEYVSTIKDVQKIQLMKEVIKKKSTRDYLLFVMGINTGLRIGQLLQLKVEDVVDNQGNFRLFMEIDNQSVYLNEQIRRAFKHHFQTEIGLQHSYLFQSSRGENPITRQQAYRIINEAAKKVGIKEKAGTHTLRKTFGYHAYVKGIAVSFIQQRFHQAAPSETLKYIGVEKTERHKIDVNL
ncbi:tyrosine-type recombinase/integrase [Alteribacillus bidgolensis]|uniref:Phage integrase family protein n=1 Tax=Alteribacillus bidgolensis TaxID=930129 RepID=A0A1G8MLD0_9BACI|nr:tyrosine-type recombinase/integrase [Alteribacillus bidgolensis]SDI68140.1 Phage integrase family protein [Alteribacillus bidgolensis]